MDSAFATAPYPSMTTGDLRSIRALGTINAVQLSELARRIAVDGGDRAQSTAGERLHGKVGARQLAENGGAF